MISEKPDGLVHAIAGERRGSLLDAIDTTVTPAGSRLLAQRLAAPLTDSAAIARRLDAVSTFVVDAAVRDDLRMDEGIVKHDVGTLQQPRRPQCQEVRCAGAGTNEKDATIHWINPAATVLLVASSIRMKLPVARLSA